MHCGRCDMRATPGWWMTVVITASAALVSCAMLLVVRSTAASARSTAPLPDRDAMPLVLRPGDVVREAAPPMDEDCTETRSHDARAALARIRDDRGIDEAAARTFLARQVTRIADNQPDVGQPPSLHTPCRWADDGDTVICDATTVDHRLVDECIEAFRTVGTAEVRIRVHFVSLQAEDKTRLMSGAYPAPVGPANPASAPRQMPPAADRHTERHHEAVHVSRTEHVVEKEATARCRILTDTQVSTLLENCKACSKASVLTAAITACEGQRVVVEDVGQRRFVVGLDEVEPGIHEPRTRAVRQGLTLCVRSLSSRGDAIHVDFRAALSHVRSVETVRVVTDPASAHDLARLEIPELATHHIEAAADLRPGQWLLVEGFLVDVRRRTFEPSWLDWLVGNDGLRVRPAKDESMLLLHVEDIHRVLQHGEAVEVGVHDDVGHVAVHEHFARVQPRDLVGRHAAVGTADPHVARVLLLRQASEEPGVARVGGGRPAAVVGKQAVRHQANPLTSSPRTIPGRSASAGSPTCPRRSRTTWRRARDGPAGTR